jgi:hypothetical protein
MCQGFPELRHHQIVALAHAGSHAIRPDKRDYGETDRCQPVEPCCLTELVSQYLMRLADRYV